MANEEELNEVEQGSQQEDAELSAAEDAPLTEAAQDSSSMPQEESAAMGEKPAAVDDDRAWFVIHCYSGYENKVRTNLESRIETMGMKDRIFDVVIPTQEEIEVREGKRRSIERHVFPGYVLVNMILSEES